MAAVRARERAALLRASPRDEAPEPARTRWSGRLEHRAGPRVRDARARAGGPGGGAGRVLATTNGGRAEEPIEVPDNAVLPGLALLLAGDGGRRPGHLPRGPRDGGAGAVARRRCSSAPPSETWARTARGSPGRARGFAAAAAASPRGGSARGRRGSWGRPLPRAGAGDARGWSRANDGAERAAALAEEAARNASRPAVAGPRRKSSQRLRGWDSNPQPLG